MTCSLCCALAKANGGPLCGLCDYEHSLPDHGAGVEKRHGLKRTRRTRAPRKALRDELGKTVERPA